MKKLTHFISSHLKNKLKTRKLVLTLLLLTLIMHIHAQWVGLPTTTTPIYRTGEVGIGTQFPDLKLHIVSKDISITSPTQSSIVHDPLQLRLSFLNQTNLNPECYLPHGQCPVVTFIDMDWDITNTGPLDFKFYNNLTTNQNTVLSLTEDHSYFYNTLNANNGFNAASGTIPSLNSTNIVNSGSISTDIIVANTITTNSSDNVLKIDKKLALGGNISPFLKASGTYANYALSVNGTIVSKKEIVQITSWADKVFDKKYRLMPLTEIEQYIATHKHLPEIPSEAEVLENGVDVGEMNKLLLQKVEELTLHLINQEKKITSLELKLESIAK